MAGPGAQAPAQAVDTGGLPPDVFQAAINAAGAPPGGKILVVQPQASSTPVDDQTDTGGLPPEVFNDAVKAGQNQYVVKSETGETVEPMPGWGPMQHVMEQLSIGGLGGVDDLNGALGGIGAKSDEQMQHDSEYLTGQVIKMHPVDAHNAVTYPLWSKVGDGLLQAVVPTAGVLGAGALGLAGAAAVTTSAPVIAAAGVGAAAIAGGTLAFGHMYAWARGQKLDPTTARIDAALAGGVATALGALNFGVAGKLGGTVLAKAMTSAPLREQAVNAAMRYAQMSGVNFAAADAGAFIDGAIKHISTAAQGDKGYSQQQWIKDFQDVQIPNAANALVFTGAIEAAGAGLGKAKQGYENRVQELTRRMEVKAELLKQESISSAEPTSEHAAENPEAGQEYTPLDGHAEIDDIQEAIDKLEPDPKTGLIRVDPIADQLADEWNEAIQGINPVSTEPSAVKKDNPIVAWMKRYGSPNLKLEGLLKQAAQDMPPDKRQIVTKLAAYVHAVVNKVEAAKKVAYDRRMQELSDSTGLSKKKVEKLIGKLAKTQITFTFTKFKGRGTESYTASGTQALQDWAWAHDPDARPGHRSAGFSLLADKPGEPDDAPEATNWQAQLKKKLLDIDPKVNDLLRGYVNDYNAPHTTEPLVEAFRQANGGERLEMNPDRPYYGRITRRVPDGHEEPALESALFDSAEEFAGQLNEKMTGQGPSTEAKNPVITIGRVKNNYPTVRTDMHLNSTNNIEMSARLAHTWQAGVILNKVFNTKNRQIVNNKLGAGWHNEIDMAIQDSLQGPTRAPSWMDQWFLKTVLDNFGYTKLGNNLLRIPMHAVLYGNASLAEGMSPAKLAAGTADFWLDPIANTKRFRDRDWTKRRYDRTAQQFIQDIKDNKEPTLLGKVKEAQMFALPTGDFIGAVTAWHACYVEYLKTQSPERAARSADRAIDTTNFSVSPDQVSNFGAGRVMVNGRVAHLSPTKLIALAAKVPTGMFELQLNDVRDALNHPTAANYAKAAQTVITVHVANALFETIRQSFILGVSKDKKRTARAVLDIISSLILGPLPPIEGFALNSTGLLFRDLLLHRADAFTNLETYPQAVLGDMTTFANSVVHANNKKWRDKKANTQMGINLIKVFNELCVGVGEAPFKGIAAATRKPDAHSH